MNGVKVYCENTGTSETIQAGTTLKELSDRICPYEAKDGKAAEDRQLADIFYRKGIHTWVDFWGHDCAHDWPWWYKQAAYFFPWLLGGEPGQ